MEDFLVAVWGSLVVAVGSAGSAVVAEAGASAAGGGGSFVVEEGAVSGSKVVSLATMVYARLPEACTCAVGKTPQFFVAAIVAKDSAATSCLPVMIQAKQFELNGRDG